MDFWEKSLTETMKQRRNRSAWKAAMLTTMPPVHLETPCLGKALFRVDQQTLMWTLACFANRNNSLGRVYTKLGILS